LCGLVAVVCAAAGIARAGEPAAGVSPPPAPQRYSLTVRGGVSLGAYEGGITWALLRALENDPGASLTTVTGASAGNINAFLIAIEWCQRPEVAARETPVTPSTGTPPRNGSTRE
jgi:hypothetical protein